MNTPSRYIRIVALFFLAWLLSPGIAAAQIVVPFTIDRVGSSIAVRSDTVPGRTYRVEHSSNLESGPAN